MYECYNEAYAYLKAKYGYTRLRLSCSAEHRLKAARNIKERKEIESSFTDNDYQLRLNDITGLDDIQIEILMKQYYYGIAAKKDLYNTLLSRGIITKPV